MHLEVTSESLRVKHILVSVSVVGVRMSSMLYVLLCITRLMVEQILNESKRGVLDFSNYLHEKNISSIV